MNELEKLLEKEKQLKAKIQMLKSREREKERKNDTRRKILVGAMVLDGMNNSEEYHAKIMQNLDKYLTKNKDRVLFGLSEVEEKKKESVVQEKAKEKK